MSVGWEVMCVTLSVIYVLEEKGWYFKQGLEDQ